MVKIPYITHQKNGMRFSKPNRSKTACVLKCFRDLTVKQKVKKLYHRTKSLGYQS